MSQEKQVLKDNIKRLEDMLILIKDDKEEISLDKYSLPPFINYPIEEIKDRIKYYQGKLQDIIDDENAKWTHERSSYKKDIMDLKDKIYKLENKNKDLDRDNHNKEIINNGYQIEQDKILEFISNELQIKYIGTSLDIGYQYYLDRFKSVIQKMKNENKKDLEEIKIN